MERWAMKRRIVGDLIYTAALTHRNAVIARKRPLGCDPQPHILRPFRRFDFYNTGLLFCQCCCSVYQPLFIHTRSPPFL